MTTATDNPFESTVLIVEDDDEFRTAIAEYLRKESFTILETNSTSEACELIRGGKVSLVLLDWDLRKGKSSPEHPSTGLEILRTCHEAHALLPVVVMSGARDFDPQGDSLLSGADSFLQKPFALPLLSVHLRRWLTRVKAEQNPFTQLAAGVIHTVDMVNRAYTCAVVEKIGSALQAAPKLGLSRQTVASYLGSANLPPTST